MCAYKWSKTKKQLDELLCPSLKSRVDYRLANYRKAHDQTGRAYITVDKKEVWNMCSLKSMIKEFEKERLLEETLGIDEPISLQEKAVHWNTQEGIYAQWDFLEVVKAYLNQPIETSLKSEDLLTKILCILDRRVGKRTLDNMKASIQEEHEQCRYFYHLRVEAERLKSETNDFRKN